MSIFWPNVDSILFSGENQPARRDFGLKHIEIGGVSVPIAEREEEISPFCTMIGFVRADAPPAREVLLVAPISGHFAVFLRDLIIGLLPFFRVSVMDWVNVRHLPAACGSFGFDANVSCVQGAMTRRAPGLHVIGLCQGGVAALAATALLAARDDLKTPATLTLIAAPIDPLANPTSVVKLLRSKPLSWFETNVIEEVPPGYLGEGRLVYPARQHLLPLWLYLARQLGEGGELRAKTLWDDGADPVGFPFLDLYTSIMDLDAKFFLENTEKVFHECLLRRAVLQIDGERVDLKAIRKTALLTVEGEHDDIAAPGQTGAAHALCSSLLDENRGALLVENSGHFSLFYGDTWRRAVLPEILKFCASHDLAAKDRIGEDGGYGIFDSSSITSPSTENVP
jgi:poly(3-hydroxybutyrate) depolymerase